MKQLALAALVAVAIQAPVLAQGNGPAEIRQENPRVTTPGTPSRPVVQPGGADNGGPGAVGTVAPGATGADSISNNSAASGNAEQNQRPLPNTGGGAGGGSGN